MQKMRSDYTWPDECFREYAEHSVEHDDLIVKEQDNNESPNRSSLANSPGIPDDSAIGNSRAA